jgi:hypothetical protein
MTVESTDGVLRDVPRFTAEIDYYKSAVHRCAVAHGWWDPVGPEDDVDDKGLVQRNMGEMMMLMVSELAEALEEHRNSEPYLYFKMPAEQAERLGFVGPQKWEGPEDLAGELGKPEGIAAEFADVIIRILDTCERLEIPITRALVVKHNYNLTRPYRHGGKAC